jgi:hypothetical protein
MTPEEAREHVRAVADRWQKRGAMGTNTSLNEEMAVYVALNTIFERHEALERETQEWRESLTVAMPQTKDVHDVTRDEIAELGITLGRAYGFETAASGEATYVLDGKTRAQPSSTTRRSSG